MRLRCVCLVLQRPPVAAVDLCTAASAEDLKTERIKFPKVQTGNGLSVIQNKSMYLSLC